jgi:uncharacterized protein YciI
MADGSGYGKRNPWQLEKSTYKHEAHPLWKQNQLTLDTLICSGTINGVRSKAIITPNIIQAVNVSAIQCFLNVDSLMVNSSDNWSFFRNKIFQFT